MTAYPPNTTVCPQEIKTFIFPGSFSHFETSSTGELRTSLAKTFHAPKVSYPQHLWHNRRAFVGLRSAVERHLGPPIVSLVLHATLKAIVADPQCIDLTSN